MTRDKKLSIEEVADIINSEGLGYAVHGYLDADQIEDPELAKLWREADAALCAISDICEEYLE